jgi:hypothetical protein
MTKNYDPDKDPSGAIGHALAEAAFRRGKLRFPRAIIQPEVRSVRPLQLPNHAPKNQVYWDNLGYVALIAPNNTGHNSARELLLELESRGYAFGESVCRMGAGRVLEAFTQARNNIASHVSREVLERTGYKP